MNFRNLSKQQVLALGPIELANWKAQKMADLLKPFSGQERIKRKKWARAVIREFLKEE